MPLKNEPPSSWRWSDSDRTFFCDQIFGNGIWWAKIYLRTTGHDGVRFVNSPPFLLDVQATLQKGSTQLRRSASEMGENLGDLMRSAGSWGGILIDQLNVIAEDIYEPKDLLHGKR